MKMGIMKRLKIFFCKLFRLATPISDLDILRNAVSEHSETLKDLENKIYKCAGSQEYYKNTLEKLAEQKNHLLSIAKRLKTSGASTSEMTECHSHYSIVEGKIQSLAECYEGQKQIHSELEDAAILVRAKLVELKTNLNLLETKSAFVESVEELGYITAGLPELDTEELTKNISISYEASKLKLKKEKSTVTIANAVRTTSFDDFVDSL